MGSYRLRMFRSRIPFVRLVVLVLLFWHVIALNLARLSAELWQISNHACEGDKLILKELEELQLAHENLRIRIGHMAESTRWRPLKDLTKTSVYSFMSEIISREKGEGPPELFEFPSAKSGGMHLCFRGNDSRNGTLNSYTFARAEALPQGHILLNGTSLISESAFDYHNPWHSHFNLMQFVYWTLVNACDDADRLIIYHSSELRRSMGNWITQIFTAMGLPIQPEQISIGDRPICFQKAVMSRLGMTGVPTEIKKEFYAQTRCQVRHFCKLSTTRNPENGTQSINITLIVRSGAREWRDLKAWERVIDDQCAKVEGCRWTSMHVASMTFCEQIKIMMETDILVSVHGAQLTNMMFMSQGGRVLEIFPKGWFELAGTGQYVYRMQARWNGLIHEGYWRDNDQPDCPTPDNKKKCMIYYKDRSVGINETYISSWLGGVLNNFTSTKLLEGSASSGLGSHGDHTVCACKAKASRHVPGDLFVLGRPGNPS